MGRIASVVVDGVSSRLLHRGMEVGDVPHPGVLAGEPEAETVPGFEIPENGPYLDFKLVDFLGIERCGISVRVKGLAGA
jgi:hypothetical protein